MPSDLTLRVAKATAAALAVVALAVGIWQVRSVLILLLLALTLAAAIRPGVEWLNRHRVPQSVGILLHFLVVGGAVALFLWLAVPPALHQIGHALGGGPVGTAGGQPTGIGDRALAWLQRHLDRLPTATELVHPLATYGHKAGEAVARCSSRSQPVGLSPLVTLLSVAVVGVLFGGLAVILAVPFTSAVATLIDVLVLGHEPPTEQPRRSLRLLRSR
jgi:predicted PurR-regulated permease PerM